MEITQDSCITLLLREKAAAAKSCKARMEPSMALCPEVGAAMGSQTGTLLQSLVQPSPAGAALSGQGPTGIETRPSAGNGLVMLSSGPWCPCAGSPRSDILWAAQTRWFLCCVGQAHGCTRALPSCTPVTQKSWEQNPGHDV